MVAFSTIFIVVIIVYFFLYGGMIGYDLFFKKDPTDLLPKQEDEEVDISDEVGQFKPIFIDKDAKTPAAQKPISEETPKIKTENKETKPENNESKPDDKTEKTETQPNFMTTETSDDEPSNRKSLSDVGPKEPDKEERERLKTLVAEKRKELLEEQQKEELESSKEASSNEYKQKEISETGIEGKSNSDSAKAGLSNETTEEPKAELPKAKTFQSNQQKEAKPYKPPKLKIVQPDQPRPEPVNYKYLAYEPDEDSGKTKLSGGEKAENVHEKYSNLTLEEIQKQNNVLGAIIQKAKNIRQPDADELEAIERSKTENRRDAVSFRGAT